MFKIFLEIAMNLYAICLLEIYIGFRILKTVFESSFAHGIFQKQSALIPFLEFLFSIGIIFDYRTIITARFDVFFPTKSLLT